MIENHDIEHRLNKVMVKLVEQGRLKEAKMVKKAVLKARQAASDAILSVWEEEVDSDNIEFLTNANLVPGDYFWVIWAIDEFENRTRSKQSSFLIQ